jgi:hypothetical protein
MKYGCKRILSAVLLFVLCAVLAQIEAWSRVAALGMMISFTVAFWGADDLTQRLGRLKARRFERHWIEWERTVSAARLQNVGRSIKGGN